MKTIFYTAVKVGLTICLFALVLRSIDIGDVVLHIKRVPASTLLLIVVLLLGQFLASGVRMSAITRVVAHPIPLGTAVRINWVGAFFAQALVTFISGDVVRAMMLQRTCDIPMRNSARSVTLDRLIGLLSSLLIMSVTAPWAIQLTRDESMRHSIVLMAIVGIGLITGFAAVGYIARHPALVQIARAKVKQYRVVYAILDTLAVIRHLLDGWRQIPKILLTSLIIQIFNVAVIFFLIDGMGAEVSIWQCLMIVPTVMLISLLPFSIAGWGLRESAMATGFSLIHAPAAAALAASVMFGALTLLLSLPGGLLWWSSQIRTTWKNPTPSSANLAHDWNNVHLAVSSADQAI
jgi:glycosyltransferase 2 family protein